MGLINSYKNAVIWPSFFVVITSTFLAVFENLNYQSEWFTAEFWDWMATAVSAFFSLVICIASLPIFLNNYDIIRKHRGFSFLAWFLLPFSVLGYFLATNILRKIKYEAQSDYDLLLMVILTLPFIMGLILSYLRFIKIKND